MGNPYEGPVSASADACPIHTFYSARSWIEGTAEDQLRLVSAMDGVEHVAAFPDLHPGKFGPVGCAILSSRLYPHLIGNDIGCGMSLYALDLPAHAIKLDKASKNLRQLPCPASEEEKEHYSVRLEALGLSRSLYPDSLGSVGGGNHFCEVQQVEQIIDPVLAIEAGLNTQSAYLLVHSGSRAFGSDIFATVKPNQELSKREMDDYLSMHDQAVRWASLNRQLIAERAARALRTQCHLIADAPHNIVEQMRTETGNVRFLHRKGAAKADGTLVPLAGSRDALSYLVHPTGTINASLESLAHGAGRKHNRRAMHGREKSRGIQASATNRTSLGGRVICEDKQMLIEEAPDAYKDASRVLADLEEADLIRTIAVFKPLITFKKAVLLEGNSGKRNDKSFDRKSKSRRYKK
nr:RNA ligase RtcB family protein [uncultured Cohaesibacter sp.]